MVNELDFLNRNLLRAYPIRQGSTVMSKNGNTLPPYVIASISLSISQAPGVLDYIPFISQVYLNNGALSIAISVKYIKSSSTEIHNLGYFQGQVTENFQTLSLNSFDGVSSGFLIAGQASQLTTGSAVYVFEADATPLEISTYLVFPAPGVTSLNYRNKTLKGNITVGTLINLTETNVGQNLELSVIDNVEIESIADRDSKFRNCPTPVITNLNGMVPYPIEEFDDDANIYLFGVDPVNFLNDPVNSTINVTTDTLTLSDFCTKVGQVLAPVDPLYLVNRPDDTFVGVENYYSKSETPVENFMVVPVSRPEYVFWPYFATTYTLNQLNPTATTYPVINPATVLGNILRVVATSGTGSVNFTVKINSTPVGGLSNLVADSNGLVVLPTSAFAFTTADTINVTINSLTGTPAYFKLVVYYQPQPTS